MPPVTAAVVLLLLLLAVAVPVAVRRRRGVGLERLMRCRDGHLFASTVVPGASIKAVRLGNVRFQRCPVGRHWTLVREVDDASLTPSEREAARSTHDLRVP